MSEKEPLSTRLKHAWNAFRNRDPTEYETYHATGSSSSTRTDKTRMRSVTEKSIISAVYTRIAIDVSEIAIQHVRQDDNGRYKEVIDSGLNYVLTTEANIDQTSKSFIQDIVLSMFDEGCVAVVPIETNIDPTLSASYEIHTMRTGKVVSWYPKHVRVSLYNEITGLREERLLPKSLVALIENPLYPIMNEPNSTLKRLIRKLNLLDAVDEQSGSGKLDLIIQLPYVIKTDARKQQAEARRKDIEMQLSGSKYGIAYTDGTERITQLNRATENNLMAQVQYLTSMLYSQLGLTEDVFNGKASEEVMLNYYNRTVTPIVSAIVDEFKRKYLTKTARTQGHSIMAFRDPFKLVPVSSLAEIADKFTRNEIMTSNEFRATIGYKPSEDPNADQLRNKNLNPTGAEGYSSPENLETQPIKMEGLSADQVLTLFDELLDGLESDIDSIVGGTSDENQSE